ncbi:MAG TPA: class I SAM-dependent methyltransferase [Planctomycetota bacterium]|nr:class I SAM-dependent methyltransferase [Planctomycetota bacterium]
MAVPCGVCGSSAHAVYQPGMCEAEGARLDWVRCAQCGVVYVHPRPRLDGHARLLQSEAYLEHGFSRGLSESTYWAGRDRWLDEADRELEALEPRLGYVGRLLEYGAGGGFFAEAARRRGWQVQTIETRKTLANYAEEQFPLPVYQGNLVDAPFDEGSFDCSVAREALSLSPDPRQVVAQLYRWTRPGGHLWIREPSYFHSPWFRGLRAAQRMVPRRFLGPELTSVLRIDETHSKLPPYLLHHFHRPSLERLLVDAGWKIEAMTGSLPRPDFLFRRGHLHARERILQWGFRAIDGLIRGRLLPAAHLQVLARRPL